MDLKLIRFDENAYSDDTAELDRSERGMHTAITILHDPGMARLFMYKLHHSSDTSDVALILLNQCFGGLFSRFLYHLFCR